MFHYLWIRPSLVFTFYLDALSRVAQRKRAGPITQRSVDRNHPLLHTDFEEGDTRKQMWGSRYTWFSMLENGACPGVEPGTSRTRSANHTTRPTGHGINYINKERKTLVMIMPSVYQWYQFLFMKSDGWCVLSMDEVEKQLTTITISNLSKKIENQCDHPFIYYFVFVRLYGEVAEWLRRWTANPLGSARVGSNPILVGFYKDYVFLTDNCKMLTF